MVCILLLLLSPGIDTTLGGVDLPFLGEAKVGRDDQGQSFGGCVRDNPCPSEIQTRYRHSDLGIGFRVAITDQ